MASSTGVMVGASALSWLRTIAQTVRTAKIIKATMRSLSIDFMVLYCLGDLVDY